MDVVLLSLFSLMALVGLLKLLKNRNQKLVKDSNDQYEYEYDYSRYPRNNQ